MPEARNWSDGQTRRGRMPTGDELEQIPDLSGQSLYGAEVKRILLLTEEQQENYLAAAREGGDREARTKLVPHRLNWTADEGGGDLSETPTAAHRCHGPGGARLAATGSFL